MPRTTLHRVFHFSARHHYGRADRSEAWNRRHFGAQTTPHGHEYRLEVAVTGTPDPETGFLMDLARLDEVVEEVLAPLEGADLNEAVPPVREGRMQPSTESLAAWFWECLGPKLPAGVPLQRVAVWESPRLGTVMETDPGE